MRRGHRRATVLAALALAATTIGWSPGPPPVSAQSAESVAVAVDLGLVRYTNGVTALYVLLQGVGATSLGRENLVQVNRNLMDYISVRVETDESGTFLGLDADPALGPTEAVVYLPVQLGDGLDGTLLGFVVTDRPSDDWTGQGSVLVQDYVGGQRNPDPLNRSLGIGDLIESAGGLEFEEQQLGDAAVEWARTGRWGSSLNPLGPPFVIGGDGTSGTIGQRVPDADATGGATDTQPPDTRPPAGESGGTVPAASGGSGADGSGVIAADDDGAASEGVDDEIASGGGSQIQVDARPAADTGSGGVSASTALAIGFLLFVGVGVLVAGVWVWRRGSTVYDMAEDLVNPPDPGEADGSGPGDGPGPDAGEGPEPDDGIDYPD